MANSVNPLDIGKQHLDAGVPFLSNSSIKETATCAPSVPGDQERVHVVADNQRARQVLADTRIHSQQRGGE